MSESPPDVTLEVDFAGEIFLLHAGEELTFGRGKKVDLAIDANPLLHRLFGRIHHRGGSWWLKNEGRRLPLTLHDLASASSVTLSSGREVSISFSEAAIRFHAGPSSYEILLNLADAGGGEEPDDEQEWAAADGLTIDQSQVPLVGEQRLLAVALCELRLRDPHAAVALPANKAIAHRFGWSMTTFNRKLDRLCLKFSQLGVSGLVGREGESALNRRQKLVEHLTDNGVITTADLALLDRAD